MTTVLLIAGLVVSLVVNLALYLNGKSEWNYTKKLGVKYNKLMQENDSLKRTLQLLKIEVSRHKTNLRIAEQSGKDGKDREDCELDEVKAQNLSKLGAEL